MSEVTACTVSELLRKNQQGVKFAWPLRFGLKFGFLVFTIKYPQNTYTKLANIAKAFCCNRFSQSLNQQEHNQELSMKTLNI